MRELYAIENQLAQHQRRQAAMEMTDGDELRLEELREEIGAWTVDKLLNRLQFNGSRDGNKRGDEVEAAIDWIATDMMREQ